MASSTGRNGQDESDGSKEFARRNEGKIEGERRRLNPCCFLHPLTHSRSPSPRARRADSSETLLSAVIPERPGSFRALISTVEPRNVTEFSYRYGNDLDAAILLGFQARADRSPT